MEILVVFFVLLRTICCKFLFFMAKDGTSFNKTCIGKECSGAGYLLCWGGFLSCSSRHSPELLYP